ncbi:MAG: hypothetical protein FWD86_03420 [Firmicutes bacterium]|nr:hypothetical protein [Bacillota bacterium]
MKRKNKLRIIKIVVGFGLVLMLLLPLPVTSPQIHMSALAVAIGIDIVPTNKQPIELKNIENKNKKPESEKENFKNKAKIQNDENSDPTTDKKQDLIENKAKELSEKAKTQPQKKIKVSALVMLPLVGGGPLFAADVASAEGNSLAEAIENLNISLGRRVEYSHCGILVLGQDYAKSGVKTELEYLFCARLVSPKINMAVSSTPTTDEFLQGLSEYGNRMSMANLFKYTVSGMIGYSNTLVGFLDADGQRGRTTAVGCFGLGRGEDDDKNDDKNEDDDEKDDDEDKSGEEKNDGEDAKKDSQNGGNGATGNNDIVDPDWPLGIEPGPFGASIAPPKDLDPINLQQNPNPSGPAMIQEWGNTAIFKDGKLIDIWGQNKSRGLSWLDQNTRHGQMFAGQNGLKLKQNRTKIKTKIDGDAAKYTLTVDLKLAVQGNIDNGNAIFKNNKSANLTDLNALKKQIQAQVKQDIYSAYIASKAINADVFKIEDRFFKLANKDYNRLIQSGFDFLADTDFELIVNIKI